MTAHDPAPDYTRGYLRVPLAVWAALYCRAPMTRRQLQLVSVVIRESWGWQKRGGEVYRWTRPLTPRHFARATGLSTDHLARDLQALVHRGVLRESEGRYQLVAEPGLWKTHPARAPEPRPPAPEPPGPSAETALSPPDVKTAKTEQRNVLLYSWRQLSPPGDKSRPVRVFPESSETPSSDPSLSERFLPVVVAFAGGLSEEENAQLRAWIQETGVPAVWEALQAAFPRGPAAVRRHLRRCLTMREQFSGRPAKESSNA